MAVNNAIDSKQALSSTDTPTFSAVTAITFNGSLNGNASTATTANSVTGGYVASAIGTANQVNVSSATGNVTFSLPQSIANSSSPTFAGITASSLASPASIALTVTSGSDAVLGANLSLSSGDGTGPNASGGTINVNGGVGTGSGTGGAVAIAGGNSGGSGVGGNVTIAGGTAGNTSTGGNVNLSGGNTGAGGTPGNINLTPGTNGTTRGDVLVSNANLKINTAGKTLEIKQGANACAGTNATMVGGTVTVSTTAVNTGDIVQPSCSSPGGVQGFISYSIIDATSFTLTSSSALDTSTFSWVIIKAA